MRYTEYEYKIDHVFDLIRLVFSSIFLAPIRLVGEISRKLVYIQDIKLIRSMLLLALGIDVVILVVNVISMFFTKAWHLFNGSVPIVANVISIGILVVFYILSKNIKKPNLIEATEEQMKLRKESIEVNEAKDEEFAFDTSNKETIIGDDAIMNASIGDLEDDSTIEELDIDTQSQKDDDGLKLNFTNKPAGMPGLDLPSKPIMTGHPLGIPTIPINPTSTEIKSTVNSLHGGSPADIENLLKSRGIQRDVSIDEQAKIDKARDAYNLNETILDSDEDTIDEDLQILSSGNIGILRQSSTGFE